MKFRWLKILTLIVLIVCAIPLLAFGGSDKGARLQPDKLKTILADFEQYAENTRKSWGVPGLAAAIVIEGELVLAKGFGVKEVGGDDAVDVNTIFQIGSASKAFTVALSAMMVDEGKFEWTDRVVDHLSDFMMSDPWVTREFLVEDLMAQHSGLPAYAGDFQVLAGFDRSHIIQSLRYLKPISSFRSRFAYVNNLFLVAASLVEKQTGQSWEDDIQSRLFEPLGMSESTTGLKAFKETVNLGLPHARFDGQVVALDKDWPFQHWVYTYGPAGGINSNVLDMAQWLRLHLGQGVFDGSRLISAKNMDFVHTPKTIVAVGEKGLQMSAARPLMGHSAFYAQGWIYVYDRPYDIIWHNGGTTGCKSVVAFVPQAGIGIVVLSNLGGTLAPEVLAQWFFDRCFGAEEKDWNQVALEASKESSQEAAAKASEPSDPSSPALDWSAYTGAYRNDAYGEVEVSSDQKGLVLTIGPDRVKIYLEHLVRDTFRCNIPNLPIEELQARFQVSALGIAETLSVEGMNDAGDGLFHRLAD